MIDGDRSNQRCYENDSIGKEGGKASGPGNEAGNKESETAQIIPKEVCTTTTVEAIFQVASPKAFSVVQIEIV
jgi:hypothetical protein